jgi:hypothetical protein
MNCKDFESTIHELVSLRMADNTKRLEALEHAGRCLWCALRLDDETRLTESLQGFARAFDGQRAPVRVEDALLRAFREETQRDKAPRLGLAGKRLWRGLSWGLVFAAAAATAWFVIFQAPRLHPRPSAPASQAVNNQPLAPSEASHAKSDQPLAAGQSARQVKDPSERVESQVAAQQSVEPRARSSTPRTREASTPDPRRSPARGPAAPVERAAPDESASAVTTDFIPLGTCDDSQCMDEALFVRVTLPAEALLVFGLATDNDYAVEDRVQADVALGSDGVPFAIRFVRQ